MGNSPNIIGRRRRSRFKEYWKFLFFPIIVSSSFSFFFLCYCATYISCHNPQILSERRLMTTEADGTFYKSLRNKAIANNEIILRIGGAGKLLGGLGSSPPRCTSKCGGCTPCKPVQVPVPPRMPVTTEYYPETWRCKCGIKLYMP